MSNKKIECDVKIKNLVYAPNKIFCFEGTKYSDLGLLIYNSLDRSLNHLLENKLMIKLSKDKKDNYKVSALPIKVKV